GSHIRYAITHDPIIYDSLVKQFWSTASLRDYEEGPPAILATIDRTPYTITESLVRSQLQLDDEGGVEDLPIADIYLGMDNLGYPSEGKMTFFKNKFSPQWRFLVHTIIHCLSTKSGSWDQFGTKSVPAGSVVPTGKDNVIVSTGRSKVIPAVIMEYLVNISKMRALWSLNKDILKIAILKTNTPYPSRKIRRICSCIHQRPQRNKAQYAEVILFYNGLEIPTRQILDSRGAIPSKTAADAKNSHPRNGREIKKVNEKVYTTQVRCEQCKGPHYTKDCPLKEEWKTLEEAYYTQFGGPFQGGGYRAAALRFYQRNNANPWYQERRQSMEDTLSKFMS
ncbi:synaptobrevin, longin-like domain protein, partial [Tanacetum coccineum]